MADYADVIFFWENQTLVTIQCAFDEKMESIFQKFFTKTEYERGKYFFKYNGQLIDNEITFDKLINNDRSKKSIKINVEKKEKNNVYPSFNPLSFQQFNYSNNSSELPNNNNFNNNSFNNYFINSSNNINNKDGILLFNEDYTEKANEILKLIAQDQYCVRHSNKRYKEPFFFYCIDCKKDLCRFCLNEHKELKHDLITHSYDVKKEELNEKMENRKKNLDIIFKEIDEKIKALNNLKDLFKFDYETNKKIADNYDPHNSSYKILNTIKKINEYETIFDDVQKKFFFHRFNEEIMNICKNNLCGLCNYIYDNYNNVINNDCNYNNNLSHFFTQNMQKDLIACNIIPNDIENIKEETDNSFLSQCEQLNECIKDNNFKNSHDQRSKSVKNFRKNNKSNKEETRLNLNIKKNNLNDSLNSIKSGDSQIVNLEENNKEIIINYKVSEKDKINGCVKLFGIKFLENNSNNICYFIYNEKKYLLKEFLELKKDENIDIIEIRFLGIDKITNPSYMFDECSSLLSIISFERFITTKVTDMSYMFNECSSLESLNGISEWDTTNVKDMRYMFSGCKSLPFLPDISKWKTGNVSFMSYMFSNCSSLKKFPDLSKWKMGSVTDVSGMFNNCEKLECLPEISKWNTKNIKNISFLFSGCKSLTSLPDISVWEFPNLNNLENVFSNCVLLRDLPDISKWDTSKVKKMNSLFEGCQTLKMLPDISEWKTHNVNDINSIFKDCLSLEEISDISKWNTDNIKNMSNLFSGCGNLIEVPDISKWNFSGVIDISHLFGHCIKLGNYTEFSKFNIKNKRIKGRFRKDPGDLANLFET